MAGCGGGWIRGQARVHNCNRWCLNCLFERSPTPLPVGLSFFWASAVQSYRRWNSNVVKFSTAYHASYYTNGESVADKIQTLYHAHSHSRPAPFPSPLTRLPHPLPGSRATLRASPWAEEPTLRWWLMLCYCHNESVCKIRLRCCLKEWIQIIRGQIKMFLAYPVNVLSGHIKDYKKLWPECDDSN